MYTYNGLIVVVYTSIIGLKLVDYSHLMAHAEKKIMKKGTVLVKEGEDNNHVHLIISGHLSVVKNKHFVARLGGHQFVGEMSFLRWQNKLDQFRHQEKVLQNIIRAKNILEVDDELGSDIIRTQKEMEIERAKKGIEGVLESGEACYADVTCLEDAVTYSWSFMDLENVLKKVS
jgi:CRP-like cAMP-binding protein